MADRTPYEVLGVSPTAAWADIKRAYKSLVHVYHPDRFHGLPEDARALAENKLKAVNAAFDELRAAQTETDAEPASDVEIRRCPGCGASNRVPVRARLVRCGRCGELSGSATSGRRPPARDVRRATSPDTACRACGVNARVSGPYCPPCVEERLGSYVTAGSSVADTIGRVDRSLMCKDCGLRPRSGGHYCEECLRKRM